MSQHERRLADWTADRWPVAAITHRWSAQDYEPEDGLPFVGPMPLQPRVLVATGFAKWGMTGGTAAGLALADHVLGRDNPWAATWAADRVPRLNSVPALASFNGQVARYLATGWASPDLPARRPLAEGEGRVETTARGKVGRCRVGGLEHEVGAVCPHLGGILELERRRGQLGLSAARFPLRPGRRGARGAGDGRARRATRALPPRDAAGLIPAGLSSPVSAGLAHRAHVVVGDAQRRHDVRVEVLAQLASERPRRSSRPRWPGANRSTGLSLKRKLLTAPTTSPSSTR